MQTVCPFPQCRYEHKLLSGEETFSVCPKCNRAGANRPPEIWRGIDSRLRTFASLPAAETSISIANSRRICCAILEDIRSLWNVGSMFRTADAMGLGQLYLAGITGSPPRKEIAKTSLGAEDHVDWRYIGHALDILPVLKAQGVMIVALERCAGSKPIAAFAEALAPETKIAMVMGNEVSGVSPETLSACDAIAELPMCGIKESLNVAVAFGVAAYALNFFLPGPITTGSTEKIRQA